MHRLFSAANRFPKLPRVLVRLSVLAAAGFTVIAAGVWLIPRFLDSQLIRDKVSAELATRFQGRLSFSKLSVLWLPRPRVIVENAAIVFDDENRGSIRSVQIYPSILELLQGRWVVREASLQSPEFHTRIAQRSAQSLIFDEKEIRAALVALAKHLPASRIALSEGAVNVRVGDHPALMLENVQAQIVGSSAELRFELGANSNLWERIHIVGRTLPENLTLQLDLQVRRFKIKEAFRLLESPMMDDVQAGEASFEVKMNGAGARQLQASVDGSLGPLVLAGQKGLPPIEAKKLKGTITYRDGHVQAEVEQLELRAPRLQASGKLGLRTSSCAVDIRVRDADLGNSANWRSVWPIRVRAFRGCCATFMQARLKKWTFRAAPVRVQNWRGVGISLSQR